MKNKHWRRRRQCLWFLARPNGFFLKYPKEAIITTTAATSITVTVTATMTRKLFIAKLPFCLFSLSSFRPHSPSGEGWNSRGWASWHFALSIPQYQFQSQYQSQSPNVNPNPNPNLNRNPPISIPMRTRTRIPQQRAEPAKKRRLVILVVKQ